MKGVLPESWAEPSFSMLIQSAHPDLQGLQVHE
jgi:hypothetical protein